MPKKHIEALDKYWEFEDTNAESIREYMQCLLFTLWEEGEGFSGKRPFGNSCWEYDVFRPLVKWGYVEGQLDEDGGIESFDYDQAYQFVFAMIFEIFKVK
jgi:hypothetical protein